MSHQRLLAVAEHNIIIAIDGHSGCGKSTTAKVVAKRLGYTYIDTGAMYRATTLYFIQKQIDTDDQSAVVHALQDIDIYFAVNSTTKEPEVHLNGKNVEQEIRQMEVSQQVSKVSALPAVRKAMVAQQRLMGAQQGVVMDGRDIGTHVFPEAALKIFMTASVDVRAKRRVAELLAKGQNVDFEAVKQNLAERDQIDTSRKENPLRKAKDAIVIDTSDLTFDQQVDKVLSLATELIH